MTLPSRRTVLRLLPALPVLSCAMPGAVPDAAFDAAAAAELARRPDDYVNGEARAFLVRRAGAVGGLLWGTMHVGYDGATVMPRQVRARFIKARLLLMESVYDRVPAATRRAAQDVTRLAMATPDPAALAALGPGTLAAVRDAGVPADAMQRLSLLGLAAQVRGRALMSPVGLLPRSDVADVSLIGFARNADIPVQGLEPWDPVRLGYLLYPPPNGPYAAADLRRALRQASDMVPFFVWVRARYAAGHVAQVAAGLTGWQAAPEDLQRADAQRVEMLTNRNRAWMPALEAGLAGDGLLFAGCGAGHLLGRDGIVALLRGRGWDVLPCVGDQIPA